MLKLVNWKVFWDQNFSDVCVVQNKIKNYKIGALNMFAIPSLEYTFGVFLWTNTDLENIQRRIRATMFNFRTHCWNSAVERMKASRITSQAGAWLKLWDQITVSRFALRFYLQTLTETGLNLAEVYHSTNVLEGPDGLSNWPTTGYHH